MIELGGNITLTGFQDRDYAELIVVKKIVGRYARQISDQHAAFEQLAVTLERTPQTDDAFEMRASTVIKGNRVEAGSSEANLFIALDAALKELVGRLKN